MMLPGLEHLSEAEIQHLAMQALHNGVLRYVLRDEITGSTALAINGPTVEHRDQGRMTVIALETLMTRLEEVARGGNGR